MITTRRYREGLGERLGRVPGRLQGSARGHEVVWIHAVSVGEVLAAVRLIGELESALNAHFQEVGSWRVFLSTTTRTGQALARERFGADRVFWFPLDFRWAVRAWLRALRPQMLILVESELWPRLLSECSRQGVPVAVVNARMSDRSFRRAKRVGRLWRLVLRKVSLFLAQSPETAHRLHALGVPQDRVQVAGNLKYDSHPRQTAMVQTVRDLVGRRPLIVAGSLLPPEERLLLSRWEEIAEAAPGVMLLIAPRHPERFDEVASLISARFPLIRASLLQKNPPARPLNGRVDPLSVVLLDTVGDLQSVYGLADLAFVGGSLARKGGHNPLEPARLGVPVIMGPSFENFREIVAEMDAAHGIEIVRDEAELMLTLRRLLRDRVEADALGQRGQRIFESQTGATSRTVSALLDLIGSAHHREGSDL